jgi:hypothetical protein
MADIDAINLFFCNSTLSAIQLHPKKRKDAGQASMTDSSCTIVSFVSISACDFTPGFNWSLPSD